ncbi:MAG: hypothetical protein JSU63_12055 [Phycisphaerales bacterium]|nr:MAG: hypothetical protein JSU63_12055 [Phycisphaerales bacterium]
MNKIGIRHEDKSEWERRAPLVPHDVRLLAREHGVEFEVESSPTRAFSDEDYREAGAAMSDTLVDCPVLLGIKEIPPEKIEPGKTYVYFSHTIKGQAGNMPALRRLLELRCQLIDHEQIVNEQNQRLVFFGPFAGHAGMIDTLWAFGQRLKHEGFKTPFEEIAPAHRYRDLDEAKNAIAHVGDIIKRDGLPDSLVPLVCGFAGYGRVSQGAQEVFDALPVREVSPDDLPGLIGDANTCCKVVFREEHMVKRVDDSAPFELQEYYDNPELYRAAFFPSVRSLTLLINCVFWTPRYPRFITREQLRELYAEQGKARLRVIGDITCDVDGSLACTVRSTTPNSPIYVYDPETEETRDGVIGKGPVVLAVDFLPCELPVDASCFFSDALRPLVPALANADFNASLEGSGLPPELRRATIVYHGQLTEPYQYLEKFVK